MQRQPLKDYSDGELINELARRNNVREKSRPEKWCHDCENFKGWDDDLERKHKAMTASYNPCQKGHKMQFVMPEDCGDADYGFYRRSCEDRDEGLAVNTIDLKGKDEPHNEQRRIATGPVVLGQNQRWRGTSVWLYN
jgi:hypothetical protein